MYEASAVECGKWIPYFWLFDLIDTHLRTNVGTQIYVEPRDEPTSGLRTYNIGVGRGVGLEIWDVV